MNISATRASLHATILAGLLAMSPLALAEAPAAGSYKIDPGHTHVAFTVSHLGFSDLVGRFNDVEGSIHFAPNGSSKVEMRIKTASVDTNHQKRDDHLRGPDFFNVKQYPEMKFVSTGVKYDAQGAPASVEGDLSLHGKTRPVTLAVKPVGAGKDPWGGYRSGYKASTVIKRSDFGMNYMQGGIGDEIAITLNIEAIKQ